MARKTAQEHFLSALIEQEIPVTIFLLCGVKLQGIITQFDEQTLLLRREAHLQLIYKQAISTIMPASSIQI